MAVLSDNDRAGVHADLMRDGQLGTTGLLKTDWRTLVNSLDQWLSDNASAANQAIPAGIRNSFTTAQKALALMYVVSKRYLSGA